MKILLPVDGSKHGGAAVEELMKRTWPSGTEVLVLSVAHPLPCFRDPLMVGLACHIDSVKEENKRANRVVVEVAETIAKGAPGLKVSTRVLEGAPKQLIVEEAERWQPDLVMLGSHGNGPAERFLLGSVAQSVAVYAPCSVEIVRNRTLAQS
jgi:nucleotide-binding universal stress UspA family protein